MTVGPENVAIANLAELRSGPTISGSLEPEQLATVRSEVSGSVLRTFVEAGERVRRGQLLANLDDRAIEEGFLSSRSAVRSAESALSLARRNLQRTERLTQAGALPERDLESARLDVTNAEGALADARARLAAAQEQLEDTRVRAPFDGVVSERQADAGDVVQLGAALFSIVDPRRLRLEASVPAEQIGRLRQGTEVEFSVTGVDRRITGRIDRINPVVDSTTRQVRIYVAIPNPRPDAGRGSVRRGSGRNRHQARRGGADHRDRQPREHADGARHQARSGGRERGPDGRPGRGRRSWWRSWPVWPPGTRCSSAPPRASPRAAGSGCSRRRRDARCSSPISPSSGRSSPSPPCWRWWRSASPRCSI